MPEPKQPRDWSPRIWEGADFFAWLRLLAHNRFAVEPPYLYIAAIVSGVTFGHTVLRWLQHGMFRERIAATRIDPPPIFVVGHWRTGTTLLHELLILDERHTSPTTLHCLSPCDFLLTEGVLKRFLWFLVPDKRPMDNMAAGWDKPQEDEFALCLLGQPSTYTEIAFPKQPPLHPGALDLSGLTPNERKTWKRGLLGFLRAVQLRDRRRLVLKSPPHTARVPVLLELFPGAKFIHISRDPVAVFASTVNLWHTLARKHGLQTPRGPGQFEEKVFREFRTLHERWEAGKRHIPAGHLTELRYEDLIADPVTAMRDIYERLGLGEFEGVMPKLEKFASTSRGYETNKWAVTQELRAKVRERWGDILVQYGYGG